MSLTEVLVEDDNALYVSYFPPAAWDYWTEPTYHGQSYHITRTPGAYATFVFNGSYVAYVSDMNYNHGEFEIHLDGKDVFTGTSYSGTVRMQQMLFESTLQPGRHTMSLVNAGGGSGDETATVMGVDYFIYHPLATQLGVPSPHSRGSSKASEYAIIATFVGVGLALAIVAIVFFVMRRRHNRRRAEVSWAPIPETAQPSVETPPPYATERPVQLAQLTKLDRWNRLRK